MKDSINDGPGPIGAPKAVDREIFQAQLDALRVREKAHTREGDAIAAARRQLPMVEIDAATPLTGEHGPVTLLDAFEGRRMLIAYYFMWQTGRPAPEQCEGCTWVTSQVRELSYVHVRDVTYATFCQGPYEESARYRDFMGWKMPWYSAQASLDTLLVGRRVGRMHLVCYLRRGSKVFETYWTTVRGVEAMDNNYRLLDLTVYGRQEKWEDSPPGWPQGEIMDTLRTHGRPTAQWSRVMAGYSDDLGTGARTGPGEGPLSLESPTNSVKVEQTGYEMPPRAGFTVTHFLTVADIERSARFYETVFGGRILSSGDGNGAPGVVRIANTWLIVGVGGGPTPDKPSVTLGVLADPDKISSFMNIRVADIRACYELWRSRGAKFITEPKDKYGETRCYIRDPDGYLIEVGQNKPDATYGKPANKSRPAAV